MNSINAVLGKTIQSTITIETMGQELKLSSHGIVLGNSSIGTKSIASSFSSALKSPLLTGPRS
jgi:hypothetical protein